jgi:hypothetical protein
MRVATPISLTDEERVLLTKWSRGRSTPARLVLRAKIVLAAAGGSENSPKLILASRDRREELLSVVATYSRQDTSYVSALVLPKRYVVESSDVLMDDRRASAQNGDWLNVVRVRLARPHGMPPQVSDRGAATASRSHLNLPPIPVSGC